MTTDVEFPIETSTGLPLPDGQVKDVTVDLPAGFIGNTRDIPQCSTAELDDSNPGFGCPLASQIGRIAIHTSFGDLGTYPVFNMEPDRSAPAKFGFNAATVTVFMLANTRPDGQGIEVTIRNTSAAIPLTGTTLTLWGVPASHAHDNERGWGDLTGRCNPTPEATTPPCPANVPETAFLSNPTSCSSAQVTNIEATSWQSPTDGRTATYTAPAPTDCDRLDFNPQIDVKPMSHVAAEPSGYEVRVTVRQVDNPTGTTSAHLKEARVTLPEGVTVNAAAAGGLRSCSEAEIALKTDLQPRCPAASRIGTVTIDTPLLKEPLEGAIYQAEQDHNPFGSTLALYLTPEGSGVRLKLAGEVRPDPKTGQLVTTFTDNPQLPFSRLTLRLKGGSRAVLVNPSTCGEKTTTAKFTPWSATDASDTVTRQDTFDITSGPNGSPCVANPAERPFMPSLTSGVIDPVAGSSSPLVIRLTRSDGDQEILSLDAQAAEGLTAALKGTGECTESQIASAACPPDSKIGSLTAGVGAGAEPYYVTGGEVFLAGPYDPDGSGPEAEASLSVWVRVRAIAGPFDLGAIVVRSAVYVDPSTAQVRIRSNPLPQILEGIPLRVRDMRIRIDKEGFIRTPTDCRPFTFDAAASGIDGAVAHLSNPFQVGDCGTLSFRPKLALRLSGATKHNGHPKLTAVVRARPGDANIARTAVRLPSDLLLENAHIKAPCTRDQYAAKQCPKNSIYGYAKAFSPLLDKPLQGPVYLRSNGGARPLPDLVASLDGQIHVDLVGFIDSVNGGLRSRFVTVPDAPVSKFVLQMKGGKKGLIVNSRNLCKIKHRAVVKMDGHNGRIHDFKPLVRASCAKKRHHKRARHHGRGIARRSAVR